jgi:hypothetical protein
MNIRDRFKKRFNFLHSPASNVLAGFMNDKCDLMIENNSDNMITQKRIEVL